ncbi:MAG TPA: glycosyltransferase family 4 protein [Gammaproteobacteria bacterium]
MAAADLLVPGDPATPTGGYLYDRRIVEGLGARGWAVRVLALDASFPRPTAAAVAAAERTLAAIPAARAVIVDGLALPGLAEPLAAAAKRLRIVALVHHPVADETSLSPELRSSCRRAERAALAAAERVVVTSRWTARRLADDGVPPDRIRVVEPGTDRPSRPAEPARPPNGAGPLAKQGGVEPGARHGSAAEPRPVRLLCVATLTERKGHALLLDALAALEDRPWRLDCVGSVTREPATARAVCERIERLGLEGRIVVHGEMPADRLEACYAEADAFVLPSYLEGYGMALAEALAHGLPVVSTTAGAIPATVPREAALLVPPGDRAALTDALRALLDDAGLRARLAAGARAAGERLPTWADAAARFAAAIADLADAPEPARARP